jgi:ribosomal protein L37E
MIPSACRRQSRLHRYGSLVFIIGLLLLQIASLPFYAGASGRWFRWRFEHGCLTIARSPWLANESFYIAMNTEGLRWTPHARISGVRDWELCIPVWIPLVTSVAWCVLAWRRRAASDDLTCARCGFSLVGLSSTTCPECGTAFTRSPHTRTTV